MVKARLSEAEWENIKEKSNIVESDGEAHRAESTEEDEVEPKAEPKKKYPSVGQMQAAKGGKPAGEVTEWESHEGYDAGEETFEKRHPTLAKAVDIGKKAVGVVNRKSSEYLKNVEKSDKKFKEMETEKEDEEEPEERKSSKKKSTKKSKGKMLDEDDFDFEDEDADITALHKSTSKQKVLPGDYKTAYGSGMGKEGYKPVYTSGMGLGTYRPAYKPTIREEQSPESLTDNRRGKKSPVEELTPREPTPKPKEPQPNRFNMQNWQSMGFPNTLPMSARGALFRPAQQQQPQQQVVPMVRQPYQPRAAPAPQPARAQAPTPQPQARRQVFGPIPRIGLNINIPQITRPKTTITPPRAPTAPAHMSRGIPTSAPLTFMGVTLGEKKKTESKPITNMGAGYKHVPLVVMNGIYPNAGYNPKTDPITKKSIIPKIQATVTPNNFTMFGIKMKNKKL
jgi:hypothetical protein